MRKLSILRLISAATLCAILAACAGEPLSQPESAPESAPTASSAEPTPSPEPAASGKQLTADQPVEGSLTLTESTLLDGYDHVSPFFDGWAFVYQNDGQAGYLSETGEFKALYTATQDELSQVDFVGIPYFYNPDFGSSRRSEIYWLGHTFRYGSNGLVPCLRDGKWGYSDLDGNMVVEPVYDQLSWLGKVGYGLRNEFKESNGTGSIYRYYDIFNSQGEVIATSSNVGWADPELGYYMIENEQTHNGDLYNADGSLVMADVPYSIGNCPWPSCDLYEGGIVLNGVAYDRTGAELPVDAESIDLFQSDLLALFDQELQDDVGTDLQGNPVLEAGLWMVSDPDESGNRYIGVQGSSAIRLYNAQFEEQPTPPLLRASKGTLYNNDAGQEVTPVRFVDQDGNEILQLEAVDAAEYPVYYPAEPLTEGDWVYWCAGDNGLTLYQVTAAG